MKSTFEDIEVLFTWLMFVIRSAFRIELYVILCSDDVYKQESQGTIVRPQIPYEDVGIML
jgi:hypothetical protein